MLHLLLPLLLFSILAQAQPLEVTPYRPTVSNPAELSALKHLEVEFGLQANQPWRNEERTSLPFLLKYPFHKNFGLLVGGEAWINQESSTGYGNTSLLLKYYLPLSSTLAIGFEGGAVLPSAKQPLGQGRTDWLGNFIISQDIADLRIDLNAGVIRQGYHETQHDQYKYSWALAASHPLTENLGIAGEFSGFLGQDQAATSQWLMALDYQVSRLLIIDFGGSVGLTDASDDYGVFTGFSVLIDP
jgi:hypothetical protein